MGVPEADAVFVAVVLAVTVPDPEIVDVPETEGVPDAVFETEDVPLPVPLLLAVPEIDTLPVPVALAVLLPVAVREGETDGVPLTEAV